MNIMSFLSKKALIKIASTKAGLPEEVVSRVLDVADTGASALGLPSVLDIIRNGEGKSVLGSLYSRFLTDEMSWPAVSAVITAFLEEHDEHGDFFPVLNAVSNLPVVHFEENFTDVNHFLNEGLFPFLRDVAPNYAHCSHCGSDVIEVIESDDGVYYFCTTCEEFQ